jgi:chemotaxis protein methyltransferase CheR
MAPATAVEADRFRDLVRARLGLDFEDAKLEQLAQLLGQRTQATSSAGVSAYLEGLSRGHAGEWRVLAERLTISESYFFRYHDHFRAFSAIVLPECLRAARGERPVRILSAGSACGEEAYSLAILAREAGHVGGGDVTIVGVDVNPVVVERAIRGEYSAWSLRDAPADRVGRHFTAEARGFRLSDGIRSMVTFAEGNLVEEGRWFWAAGALDVVFCRNVLMYMTPEAMRAVVARLAETLRPGGYLFLGHAETLRGISQDFHLRHTHDTFYYERRTPGASLQTPDLGPLRANPGGAPDASLAGFSGLDADVEEVAWADAIARSSERVAALVDGAAGGGQRASLSTGQVRPSASPAPDRQRVLQMMREERFAEALDTLGADPEELRRDPDTQLLRAVLLTNGGRFAEAEAACEELLRADALSAGAHYLAALCREHAGDLGSAIDHDQMACHLVPGFAMPRLHLGILERRAGRCERALVALRQAMALLPTEDTSRILLFGGGFGRDALVELCRAELRRCGGDQ